MSEILNISGLSAGYGPLRVIHDLDLVIKQGERLGLVGLDRKSTRLNSSHIQKSRMPSSA